MHAGAQATGRSRNRRYVVRCACGRLAVVFGSNLVGGRTLSCGCFYRETRPKAPRVFRYARPRTGPPSAPHDDRARPSAKALPARGLVLARNQASP